MTCGISRQRHLVDQIRHGTFTNIDIHNNLDSPCKLGSTIHTVPETALHLVPGSHGVRRNILRPVRPWQVGGSHVEAIMLHSGFGVSGHCALSATKKLPMPQIYTNTPTLHLHTRASHVHTHSCGDIIKYW